MFGMKQGCYYPQQFKFYNNFLRIIIFDCYKDTWTVMAKGVPSSGTPF